MLLERGIHIFLNGFAILGYMLENLLFNGPPEKVQLTNSGRDLLVATGLKEDTLPSAKGVKETLGIGIELALVLEIDQELTVTEEIRGVVLFRIVGDEIVNETETHG